MISQVYSYVLTTFVGEFMGGIIFYVILFASSLLITAKGVSYSNKISSSLFDVRELEFVWDRKIDKYNNGEELYLIESPYSIL